MSIYKGNKLIAGGPNRPNWAKAVLLDIQGIYKEGYNVPSNGIIVGYLISNPRPLAIIKINDITVARATFTSSGSTVISGDGNVQCPVNKNDHITIEVANPTTSHKLTGEIHFVPFIDDYTGN